MGFLKMQSFAILGLKHLPRTVLQGSNKEYRTFLKFSYPLLRLCKNFSVSLDANLFEDAQVQKYFKYIASEVSQKKHQSNEELVSLLKKKQQLENEIKNLENMASEGNKELEKLIESEKEQYFDSIKQMNNEIFNCLFLRDNENDNRNVELKIIPGIGGEEAKLFREELFDMYLNYAEFKNWECKVGVKDDYFLITGKYVFGYLKHEAGVHRVQRVPETENSGRVHTSTCSVVVLPQPKSHEIDISEKDVTIERMKSSGPGGQNVNKRETCVRIKHTATGIVVENQTSRTQPENLKVAIDRLRSILYNMEREKVLLERKTLTKEQAGTNDYSDKIRTYNFPQNRVTDHRINYSTHNLEGFLSGEEELDNVIEEVKRFNLKREFLMKVQKTLETVEYKEFERQFENQLIDS